MKCIDCPPTSRRKASKPGPRCSTHHREARKERRNRTWAHHIWETYGLTEDEYWRVYDAQGGVCADCRRANGKRKRLSVDHDHSTGELRELLCGRCNNNRGFHRDDPEAFRRVADNLENPTIRQVLGPRYAPGG